MMHPGKIVCFVVAICLMACRPTVTETSTAGSEAVSQIGKGPACPSQDFTSFLQAFMEDVVLQKAFTRNPYEATIYDPQNLEADPGVQKINTDQIPFPVILSPRDMADQGVKVQSQKRAHDWYEVSTQSEGTGAYSMTFNFRYLQGCWFLTDSVDAST